MLADFTARFSFPDVKRQNKLEVTSCKTLQMLNIGTLAHSSDCFRNWRNSEKRKCTGEKLGETVNTTSAQEKYIEKLNTTSAQDKYYGDVVNIASA